jgi:hypothetical protein
MRDRSRRAGPKRGLYRVNRFGIKRKISVPNRTGLLPSLAPLHRKPGNLRKPEAFLNRARLLRSRDRPNNRRHARLLPRDQSPRLVRLLLRGQLLPRDQSPRLVRLLLRGQRRPPGQSPRLVRRRRQDLLQLQDPRRPRARRRRKSAAEPAHGAEVAGTFDKSLS